MKKELFLIISLLAATNARAYKFTVQNKTKYPIKIEVYYSKMLGICSPKEEFTVNPKREKTIKTGICCMWNVLAKFRKKYNDKPFVYSIRYFPSYTGRGISCKRNIAILSEPYPGIFLFQKGIRR